MGKYLTMTQIVLCLASSVAYALARDWRKATYWLAAGVIGITVL